MDHNLVNLFLPNLNGSILRITTRYDNRYSYDVEVEKVAMTGSGSDFDLLPYSNLTSTYALKNGFAVHIIFELSRLLNFSYELITSVGAYEFDNATRSQIDIFASSYVLSESRAKIVDPTYVTGKSKISAFFNEEFESTMHDILISPFQTILWFALIGLAMVMVGIGAVCLAKVEGAHVQVLDAQFQFFALILLRDNQFNFTRSRNRLVLWITSISFVVISAHFCANLISTKTVNISGIRSLGNLADSKYYGVFIEYGYNNGSTIQEILEAVTSSVTMSKILKKAALSSTKLIFQNFQQIMHVVKKLPIAYVIDEETGFSAIDEAFGYFPCNWNRISFQDIQYPWSMYMRKNMTHKKAINTGLLRLDEVGILSILRRRWIPHLPAKCTAESNSFNSVGLNQLHFAFIALSIGFVLALIGILLERFYFGKFMPETNPET